MDQEKQHKYDVALSFADEDRDYVDEVARILKDAGVEVFYDLFEEAKLWGKNLYTYLDDIYKKDSRYTIMFCSKHYAKKLWTNHERERAQARAFKEHEDYILPARFDDTEIPGILDTVGYLSLSTKTPEEFCKLVIAKLNGEPEPPPIDYSIPPCPYRGLAAFEEEHEPFFFGRKKFIKKLVKRVKENAFVAIIGASGSGKSSVVLAGLFPELRRENNWLLIKCRPEDKPFRSLSKALIHEIYNDPIDRAEKIQKLSKQLSDQELELSGVIEQIAEKHACQNTVIFTDQFEELFTLCTDDQQRKTYIDVLLKATQVEHIHWVLTMRADFMNQALMYPALLDALQDDDLKIGPMIPEELAEAIVEPAKKQGVSIEQPLLSELFQDIEKSPSSLPLLQFTLKQLWEKQKLRQLSYQAYQEIGGLEKALTSYADEIYTGFKPEQQKQIRQIFIQLVSPGAGTEDTRKIATKSQIGDEKWPLVQSLADKSLIVSNKKKEDQEETVEVIHEALIKNWHTLTQWMKQDREFRIWQERLRITMEQYEKNSQDDSALLRGTVLSEAEDWLNKNDENISEREKEFIQKSSAVQAGSALKKRKELAEKERRKKQIIQGLSALVIVMVLLFLLFLTQFYKTEQLLAENNLKTQETQYLLAQNYFARGLKAEEENKLNTAWHFFVRALETYPRTAKKEIKTTRLKLKASQTSGNRVTLEHILEHEGAVTGIKYSSDESQILSWSEDETVRVWRAQDGALVAQMKHGGEVQGAMFSGDGSRILSWSRDGTARVWRAQDGALVAQMKHESWVRGAVFSGDESRILSWSWDGTARVWQAQDGALVAQMKHEKGVVGAVFSRDGSRILSWSGDPLNESGTARVWQAQDGALVAQMKHEQGVLGAAFSGDESRILSWSGFSLGTSGTARVWQAQDGALVAQMKHEGAVYGAVFSGDGSRILSWSSDGTARVWQAQDGALVAQMKHEGAVYGAAFSGDGSRILSWSSDGTARVWQAQDGALVAQMKHEETVQGAVFSGDGSRILSWSNDRTVHVWQAQDGALVAQMKHEKDVEGAAFSGDGSRIVSWSGDGTARVWQAQDGALVAQMKHEETVQGAVFSGDGSRILSWSWDGTARVWQAQDGALVAQMKHERAVEGAAFSGDESRILSWSYDGTARLWQSQDGALVAQMKHERAVEGAAFSGDKSRILSRSRYGTVRLWQAQDGALVAQMKHESFVVGAAFSGDGSRIVSWSRDGTARVWRAQDGALVAQMKHEEWVLGATFSGDGSRILSWSGDGTARVWQAQDGALVAQMKHEGSVYGAAFSGDGSRILSWSGDGTARVWQAQDGALVAQMKHEGWVLGAAFSGDESRILSWSRDGTARLWDFSIDNTPIEYLQLELEVLTGLKISDSGQIRVLKTEEWKQQKEQYEAIMAEFKNL